MKNAKLDLGFEVSEVRSGVLKVSVKGSGLGVRGFIVLGIFALFVGFPAAGFLASIVSAGGTVIVILGVAIAAGLLYLANWFKSQAYEFELTETELVKDGVSYKAENISEIFVDNGHAKGEAVASGGGLAVGGFGLAGISLAGTMTIANAGAAAVTNTATAAGARVNYRVNIRHGRKVVPLAKHLNEETAISLFNYLTAAK